MGFNVGKAIGSFINNASGATEAANVNWTHQKELAQNAYQWEVEDLTKAGLNPVYSANSQGATTGGANPGMQPGGTGFINSAMSALTEGSKILQQQKKVDAETSNLDADTANKHEENPYIGPLMRSNIALNETKGYLNTAQAGLAQKRQGLVLAEIGVAEAEKDLKTVERGMDIRQKMILEKQLDRIKMENQQLAKQYDVDSRDLDIQRKYLDSKTGSTLRMLNMAFSDAKPALQTAGGIAGAITASKYANKFKPGEHNYTTINNYNEKPTRKRK